jgi:hypothetical protein
MKVVVLGPPIVTGSVRAKAYGRYWRLELTVEEKLDQNVDSQLSMGLDVMESKSPDLGQLAHVLDTKGCITYDEENGEHREADELKGLATNGVYSSDSKPVSRNGSRADQNTVSSSDVVELVVNSEATPVADRCKDCGLVETKAVESNLGTIVSRLIILDIQEHSHQATTTTWQYQTESCRS